MIKMRFRQNLRYPVEKFVLIVDDAVDMQNLLKVLLDSKGYRSEFCSNGEEALKFLQSSDRLPDLILLDLRMPVMDGYDFLSHFRKVPEFKNIPVVLMSGDEDEEIRDIGSESVLKKPLTLSSVIGAIETNTAH